MESREQRSSNFILILIAINAVLLIAKLALPDLDYVLGLHARGWLDSPWTLITSMFIHADIWHITTNMLTLYFFGTFLASVAGIARFLIVYFLGGVAGGLLFILLSPPNSVAIGASGAVFAVGATVAIIKPKLKVLVFPIPSPVPIWAALLGGLIIMSLLPNIAWQAHLGGAAFGSIAGLLLRKQRPIIL